MFKATRGVADTRSVMRRNSTVIDVEVAIIGQETLTTIEIEDMMEREEMKGIGI